MTIFSKTRYYKCCIAMEFVKAKEMILLEVTKVEGMICQYWFVNHGLTFQDSIWNACHDLTMFSLNIRDIAITTIKNVDYRCIIYNINRSEVIDLLGNSVIEVVNIYKKYCLNF